MKIVWPHYQTLKASKQEWLCPYAEWSQRSFGRLLVVPDHTKLFPSPSSMRGIDEHVPASVC